MAASAYLGIYFLPATWAIRHLYRRRQLPIWMILPVVWTGIELLRSRGPLAFPWFLLGHSQVRLLSMIQIADLAGVCGITFILSGINGWLADIVLRSMAISRRGTIVLVRPRRGASLILWGLVAANLVYGHYRLREGSRKDEGPRIAVIQGDFLLEAVISGDYVPDSQKSETYFRLSEKAVADQPDLMVFPETPWFMVLNREGRPYAVERYKEGEEYEKYHRRFSELARQNDCQVVIGAMSVDPQPRGSYPPYHRYNSAMVYLTDKMEPVRYDKIHLVPFGEFVPFRYTRGLHWLYRFLNDGSFNPWGRGGYEYSLTAGQSHTVFAVKKRGEAGREYRYGITICYEDVIPYVFRRFVTDSSGHKRVDFMLNISNDGWFGHTAQQAQHLVNCVFRAVENRIPVARAVNTGVSGFVWSDGSWHDLVTESGHRPRAGGTGYRQAVMPLDSRVSFYSMYGDIWGYLCLILTFGAIVDSVYFRFRKQGNREDQIQRKVA